MGRVRDKVCRSVPESDWKCCKTPADGSGALIIQTKFQFSDHELVEQITKNPYLQYFIGLPGYQEESPFDASTLVLFRKRITMDMLMEANEYILAKRDDHKVPPSSGSSGGSHDPETEPENKGTLTLDAGYAPAHIRYPQDISRDESVQDSEADTLRPD